MRKKVLIGAGEIGIRALLFFGNENVYAFADSQKAHSAALHAGKTIFPFSALPVLAESYDLVVTAVYQTGRAIKDNLEHMGISDYSDFWDIYSPKRFTPNPYTTRFKGRHQGESCIIVGNGPSLTAADLSILHNNKGRFSSFGCNNIFVLYEQTAWRPTFYFNTHVSYLASYLNIMKTLEDSILFLRNSREIAASNYFEADNKRVFHFSVNSPKEENISAVENCFSLNPPEFVYSGMTVTYMMLQWAVYMGFQRIYLLGVDNGYTGQGKVHFYEGNESEKAKEVYRKNKEIWPRYYSTAGHMAQKLGVGIYNATRGGYLEVFERVNFDSLMEKA